MYIYVEVEADDIFTRDGNDVVCELPVSFVQAIVGDKIRVPTLVGEAELKIPPGTQPGTLFRLRGMGIKDLRGYHKGDQIVRVQVEIPTRVSREQRDLIDRFAQLSNEKTYPMYQRFMEKLKKSLGG